MRVVDDMVISERAEMRGAFQPPENMAGLGESGGPKLAGQATGSDRTGDRRPLKGTQCALSH